MTDCQAAGVSTPESSRFAAAKAKACRTSSGFQLRVVVKEVFAIGIYSYSLEHTPNR
jgi:hypothetical protein